jgi:hypothetical protein
MAAAAQLRVRLVIGLSLVARETGDPQIRPSSFRVDRVAGLAALVTSQRVEQAKAALRVARRAG